MELSHETHVSEAAVLRLDDSHYVSETLVSTNAPTVQPIFQVALANRSSTVSNSPEPAVLDNAHYPHARTVTPVLLVRQASDSDCGPGPGRPGPSAVWHQRSDSDCGPGPPAGRPMVKDILKGKVSSRGYRPSQRHNLKL
jgi:hypothetical protein